MTTDQPTLAVTSDVVRDLSSESVCGFRVAAYRETHPEYGAAYGHSYCEHWSTPNTRDPRVKVERLFTETQLREALSRTHSEPRPAGDLREALRASLAKRSRPTMDPPWTAAFNAALDMVARDVAPFLAAQSPAPTEVVQWWTDAGAVKEARLAFQNGRKALLLERDRNTHLKGVYEPIIGALEPMLSTLAELDSRSARPSTQPQADAGSGEGA